MPMYPKDQSFHVVAHVLTSCVLALLLRGEAAADCEFPQALRMEAEDPPWLSHVRAGPATATSGEGSVGVPQHDTEYFIRQTVMEIHYPGVPRRPHVRWTCSMEYHGKLLLKRQDHHVNSFYRCAKFYFRSASLVQIAWSREAQAFDVALCADEVLTLDPYLLIRSETLHADHSKCPFSGGFDMKLMDSQTGENGCNLMLRPMRLEAECVGGDGVVFDFMTSNCLPDVRMFVRQRTLCVASWKDRRNHFIVLRRNEDTDLWCMVVPITRSTDSVTKVYLYRDLACWQHPPSSASFSMPSSPSAFEESPSKYLTLLLTVQKYPTLCEDEYSACSTVKCNAHIERECRRSCEVCDAEAALPTVCEYPRRLQGHWQLNDVNGARDVRISDSNISIAGVGNFQCVTYPDGPDKKSRVFTTVSLSSNGCRPRFTCVKLRRLGPAVLSYSLSRSIVWPQPENDYGKRICDEDLFLPDPSPIDDLYRSHEGSGKPIVARAPDSQTVACNISALMTISATLPEGYICMGSMFKHCEDPTKLRLEFSSCGNLVPASSDYQCLANFKGHDWEKILLVRNLRDPGDVRCFVFNDYYPNELYSLLAGQCDKLAFAFARSRLRKPLLKIEYREEAEQCKSVPTLAPTLPATTTTRRATSQPQRLVNSHDTMGDQSTQDKNDSGSLKNSIPASKIIDAESPAGKVSGQTYKEPDRPTSLEGGDKTLTSKTNENFASRVLMPSRLEIFLLSLTIKLFLT